MKNRRPDAPYRGPVQQDRPARLVLFMRRHKRGLRLFVAFLVLLGLAGFGISALHLSGSESRFAPYRAKLVQYLPFQIKTIRVEGRNLTPEDDLMKALGTSVGQPIFGFSVSAARDRIDALPFVDHAMVSRHMPDTVVVNIVERSPIAVWQDHGHFILINRAGEKVPDQGLEGKNGQAFIRLPLVVGEGANVAASSLVDALTANPTVKDFVVAAVRIGQRRWNLTLRDGATVLLPEGQEQAALNRLTQYQTQFRLLERPVVSIDMRLPDRMVIHQPPAPETPPGQDQGKASVATPGQTGAQTDGASAVPDGASQATPQGTPANAAPQRHGEAGNPPQSRHRSSPAPATRNGGSTAPNTIPADGAPTEE
ncbi:cell division protein FtsQ/DivIB [Asaia krungthepensis]|uniref:Cell division protein FtsQ n=1 Tax=Asaia krungthepensis NRIC 0535 TaxID=1307925 RepID=A0ABQ0Q1W7_9PROT|nr:FtsQ-type POTRA domain-containing protein [Asaia krungthepensis]GBQ87395.1 cell division protein FtsQ [Asaia krungthepensis NRIC 0535]